MISNAPEMPHQLIEFFKCRAAISLVAFSDQAKFLDHGDGIIEFLPRKRISPGRPRNRKDTRKVREIIATSLRLDVLGQLACERHQCLTSDIAAFGLAEIAILDGLEHLGLRSQDCVFRFRDVTVDHGSKSWVLFVVKSARTFEFSLALYDPGIGSLFAVKCLRLAMNDPATFLDDDLGREGFGAVFTSPSYYRAHLSRRFANLVLAEPRSVGVVSRSYRQHRGTTGT